MLQGYVGAPLDWSIFQSFALFAKKEVEWNAKFWKTCLKLLTKADVHLPVKYLEPFAATWKTVAQRENKSKFCFSNLSSWTQINQPSWFNNHSNTWEDVFGIGLRRTESKPKSLRMDKRRAEGYDLLGLKNIFCWRSMSISRIGFP